VVIDVLEGCAGFETADLQRHVGAFGPLVVGLMGREFHADFQGEFVGALQRVVARIVEGCAGVDCSAWLVGREGDGRGSRRASSLRSPRV